MTSLINWIKIKKKQLLPIGSIRERISIGSFWLLIGTVFTQGMALLAYIIIARMLGKEGFGEFGIIKSTIEMLSVFAGFSIGITSTKYVAEFYQKDKKKTSQIITLTMVIAILFSLVIGGVLVILSNFISEYLNAPHISLEIAFSSGFLIFNTIVGAQFGIFVGFEWFKLIAKLNILNGVLTFTFLTIGVYLFGLLGIIIFMILISGINAIIGQYFLISKTKKIGVKLYSKNFLKVKYIIWKFSIPTVFSNILVSPVIWFSFSLMANQPEGYSHLGIFNAANQWKIALVFIPTLIGQATLPVLTSYVSLGKIKTANKIFKGTLIINLIILIPLGFILISLSNWIMIQYGPGFEEGYLTLIVLIILSIIYGMGVPAGRVIIAFDKMWYALILNIIWALILLSAYIGFFLSFGSLGLGISLLISYSIYEVLIIGFAFHLLTRRNQKEILTA